ncbi:hypothetical protein CABS01_09783 [Colletotrichum abscissum]|uniref:Secreted protein n=1 Tax=Colletotrichum tamarilloi TaxID=1209934 RepID=A0ABQ9QTQ1_9PEZI|nr:uncharacterized protein CTAM01_12822 [Colletotrichum tamarilloi]XP_060399838.1 uncharacterized protein CABS01_09783 [Colletotrichum abscissum]KAI3546851.1 hypothetical protein CSPX01_04093 [Colletotrichum filicis]KAK1484733.1 hypothetical protein CTAM01_12822 [Colletotrichum tamarilloi]KAK1501048.1 hypothetical protein CABS01_09783 [Colletotrichum abscissum]
MSSSLRLCVVVIVGVALHKPPTPCQQKEPTATLKLFSPSFQILPSDLRKILLSDVSGLGVLGLQNNCLLRFWVRCVRLT